MQKMDGTFNIAHGKKSNMSSTPYYGHYPGSYGPMSAPKSLRNPCTSQPLVSDELPYLKGLITTYIIHNMLSFPRAQTSNRKKNQEKEKG